MGLTEKIKTANKQWGFTARIVITNIPHYC